jgi:bacillaene synthase trans-acting acyltransferase
MKGTKTVFMFSGQGSQYFHMGRPLYQANEIFRAFMRQLDDLVRELSGSSVLESMYSSANNIASTFDNTALTHPAIFMVEYSLARALMESGVVPDVVLGASLGSFAAATLAGCVTAGTALAAVVGQARSLEDHCEPGGMLAILADPALYGESFLRDSCDLAAVNFPSHFVVSAPHQRRARIEAELDARTIPWQRLAVSFAFHSRWIDAARTHFETYMQSIPVGSCKLPLVCCDQAAVLGTLHSSYFWDVTRRPIRFREAIAALERRGRYRYVDVGPAGTLATFLKYLLADSSRSTVHPILTPYGHDLRNWDLLTRQR